MLHLMKAARTRVAAGPGLHAPRSRFSRCRLAESATEGLPFRVRQNTTEYSTAAAQPAAAPREPERHLIIRLYSRGRGLRDDPARARGTPARQIHYVIRHGLHTHAHTSTSLSAASSVSISIRASVPSRMRGDWRSVEAPPALCVTLTTTTGAHGYEATPEGPGHAPARRPARVL